MVTRTGEREIGAVSRRVGMYALWRGSTVSFKRH